MKRNTNSANIHKEEEEILQEWKTLADKFGEGEELVTDGLLLRGEIFYENGCWHRLNGNEEALFHSSCRRLLILTKDLNDDEAWDIRQETGRLNTVAFSYDRAIPFYKNLRMWSYGLLNSTLDGYPDFKKASDMGITGPFYESAPIARINCKKQVGSGSIKDYVLMHYLEKYATLLKKQMSLYDADIILCCGCSSGRNLIMDFVKSQYLTDLVPVPDTGNWIWYSPASCKVVINSYHPSARIGYEDTYCDMMESFRKGLEHIKNNYDTTI